MGAVFEGLYRQDAYEIPPDAIESLSSMTLSITYGKLFIICGNNYQLFLPLDLECMLPANDLVRLLS